MNSNGKARNFLFLFLALALGIYLGSRWLSAGSGFHDAAKGRGFVKLNELIQLISRDYVDSVDIRKIEEEALQTLLHQLDPHSEYISAEEFNEVNDPLTGSFEGIGIQFNIQKDTVLVVQTISGGPSEKAGLHAGDRIVKVDGELIAGIGISNQEVMKRLKGPRKTTVKVTVFRRGVKKLIEYTITRDKIPTNSIDAAFMFDNITGYVKISRFATNTHQEFKQAVNKLIMEGMQVLVIDLRSNGGGVLQAAIEIADELLPRGSTIVYTEGRQRPKETFYAQRQGLFESRKLILFIDEFSASASEIIAGAIQDNDRGIVIGRRSFGKGLVQEQIRMNDGSAIRLTVSRYYSPSGRCIQSPYDDGSDRYYEDFLTRIIHRDSLSSLKDSTQYLTKKGRVVYGGGGIYPDILIPYDTAEESSWLQQLSGEGLLYAFALDYTDANRSRLEKFGTAENFANKFRLSETEFIQFLEWCRANNAYPSKQALEVSKEWVVNRLEAFIGRNVFGDSAFFRIFLKTDKYMKEAKKETAQPLLQL